MAGGVWGGKLSKKKKKCGKTYFMGDFGGECQGSFLGDVGFSRGKKRNTVAKGRKDGGTRERAARAVWVHDQWINANGKKALKGLRGHSKREKGKGIWHGKTRGQGLPALRQIRRWNSAASSDGKIRGLGTLRAEEERLQNIWLGTGKMKKLAEKETAKERKKWSRKPPGGGLKS